MKINIILLLFLFTSCKVFNNKEGSCICNYNCFNVKGKKVYLNFVNNKDTAVFLPNISSVIDNEFYLIKDYYTVRNDTLYIVLTQPKNINISHAKENVTIKVVNESIKIEANKKLQQFFIIDEKFHNILIDKKNYLKQCKAVPSNSQ